MSAHLISWGNVSFLGSLLGVEEAEESCTWPWTSVQGTMHTRGIKSSFNADEGVLGKVGANEYEVNYFK